MYNISETIRIIPDKGPVSLDFKDYLPNSVKQHRKRVSDIKKKFLSSTRSGSTCATREGELPSPVDHRGSLTGAQSALDSPKLLYNMKDFLNERDKDIAKQVGKATFKGGATTPISSASK